MLRMGKNPKADQSETEHTTENQQQPFNSPTKTYAPYQSGDSTPRPSMETSAPPSRAITESESLARDIKEGTLSGFVGNGTVLTGEASFKAMLRVDGHLSGRISSDGGTLIVGTNGRVDANIEVAVATIHGTVNGDIVASQRLELGRAAKVNGNIQTPSLVIEQGALFEGSCRMVQLKAAQDKNNARDKGRSETTTETATQPPVTGTTGNSGIANVSEVPS